jgi:integrase
VASLKLTKRNIDTIKPPLAGSDGKGRQLIYWDTLLPCFGLRVTTGGSKTYVVENRINGRSRRIKVGSHGHLTPEQARKQAQALLADIARGIDPVAERNAAKTRGITLEQAYRDYLSARKNLMPRTLHDYQRCIEGELKSWLSTPLVEISKDMVQKRHRSMGNRSHARANNTMRVLRAIFNYARENYDDASGQPVLSQNPVDFLSKSRAWYKVERRRTLLKPHELKPWYEAVMLLNFDATRDYLLFLIFTGLRRSEAAGLRWEQVDLIDKSFCIEDTKNHEPHILPLSNFLFDLLSNRNAHNFDQSPWVFPSAMNEGHLKEPRTAIAKVTERSGVAFQLHDLRRTFITIAESLDIPAYALKRLLNHKQANDVTAGYIVPTVDRMREPMQRITDYLQAQMQVA